MKGSDVIGGDRTGEETKGPATMAKKSKYRAAPRAGFSNKDAALLGAVLESLGGANVPPKAIVDAARPVRSPIHHLFQWDDTKAAEEFRLWQARHHVNHIEIVIVGGGTTKAFHNITIETEGGEERGYYGVATIRHSPDLSSKVVAKALRELNAWRAKYKQYRAIFGEVHAAIDSVNGAVRKGHLAKSK